jgi:lipopolysaccharide export system permease protein
MRILDRYIIGSFLKNYVLSFVVLVGLYIVLDMVFNFDELLQTRGRAGTTGLQSFVGVLADAGEYYLYQSFLYFVHLSGIIPVVAASFTLLRMSRFNELTALLAAGTPLLRVAAPIIIAGLVLNVVLLADQELVIPSLVHKLVRRIDEVRDTERNSFPVRAMMDDNGGLLVATRFYAGTDPPEMRGLGIIHKNSSLVTATRAVWDQAQGQWRLENGHLTENLGADRQTRRAIDAYKSNITPQEIHLHKSGEFVELLSTARINELLARPRVYGKPALVRARHARFTQPIANVILLLLAVGCVLTREPRQMKLAAGKCVVLCGLCMTAVFISQQLAVQAPENTAWADAWPALMAWMPIFIFGPGAVWLLDRVKT